MATATPRFPLKIKRNFASVTIYRRPHPKTASGYVFRLVWTVGGHRYQLQRATLASAQVEATAKVEQLAAGRLAVAQTMTADDAAILSRARRLCGNVPVISALEEWAEARKLCQGSILQAARAFHDKGGAPKPVTVPQAVKAFLASKKKAGVDTGASYDYYLTNAQRGLSVHFTGPVSSVSASMLERWMDEQFPGADSYNTARKRIVTLWRWARIKRFLPQDALTEAERVPRRGEEVKKRGILTVAEYARTLILLRDEQPDYLAAGVLAGFCGLRSDEISAQRWDDVRLKDGNLTVTAAKKGTPEDRLVEIPRAAVEWLMLCDRTGELVAPAWAQDRIRAFCRGAKPAIPTPKNAYRHSFVTYHIAKSRSVDAAALEAGNSSAVIEKHYKRPVPREDGEAWFALTPAKAASIGTIEALEVASG